MSTEPKLKALQKTFEIEEQRSLVARQKIDRVVDQRNSVILKLHFKRDELLEKLHRLRGNDRIRAIQEGDGRQLASISRFLVRIEKKLAELNEVIASREKELLVARERLKAADDELIGLRLEKKRVERLLEKREFSERIRGQAHEEALTDEMSVYRRRKQ